MRHRKAIIISDEPNQETFESAVRRLVTKIMKEYFDDRRREHPKLVCRKIVSARRELEKLYDPFDTAKYVARALLREMVVQSDPHADQMEMKKTKSRIHHETRRRDQLRVPRAYKRESTGSSRL